jgi:hypothetical protein
MVRAKKIAPKKMMPYVTPRSTFMVSVLRFELVQREVTLIPRSKPDYPVVYSRFLHTFVRLLCRHEHLVYIVVDERQSDTHENDAQCHHEEFDAYRNNRCDNDNYTEYTNSEIAEKFGCLFHSYHTPLIVIVHVLDVLIVSTVAGSDILPRLKHVGF